MVWLRRGFGRAQNGLSNRRIRRQSAQYRRGVTHLAGSLSIGLRRVLVQPLRRHLPDFEVHRVGAAPANLLRFHSRG